MTGGCTIGAKIGAKIVSDRYLLFKNRDLVYEDYKCSTTYHEVQLDFQVSNEGKKQLVRDFP